MMYSEFVEGTGCKDSEYNYNVFKNLEIMYMKSNLSMEEVYEHGKKHVDNSKSEAELKAEAKIKEDINVFKQYIEWIEQDVERYQGYLDNCINTKEEVKEYKDSIKRAINKIRHYRARIRFLKDCLA